MRAALTHDHHLIVGDAPQEHPGHAQLLIHVDASGICGSDLHALEVLENGVVLGHEFTGTVVELGEGVTEFSVGDRIVSLPVIGCKHCAACLSGDPINCPEAKYLGSGQGPSGSFGQMLVVDEQASLRIPDSVSLDEAGLLEPVSIALKVFERSAVRVGDKVLVIGGGPIGLAVTGWARASGVGTIVVSDPVASRRDLALALGATHVVDPLTTDLAEYFQTEFGSAPEVIIECAGRPGTFSQAVELVAFEGHVVIAGMHMKTEEFGRMAPFLKNVRVTFSCWYTKRHWQHAIAMISTHRVDFTPMITHHISVDELPDTIEALHKPNEYGKVLVLMN